jgi:hypothetical protein
MHTLSDLTLDARGFGTSIITSKAADLMDSRILRIVETYAIRNYVCHPVMERQLNWGLYSAPEADFCIGRGREYDWMLRLPSRKVVGWM